MLPLRSQQGITLVEVLVAVAVSSLISAGLGSAIYQFISIGERTSDAQKTLRDVQNAGHWLTLDGKKASSTDLDDGGPAAASMTLHWTVDSQDHSSTYYLDGTAMKRDHNGTVLTVARSVSSLQFTRGGQLVIVAMTSTPNGRWGVSKQVNYNLWIRPDF